jgi:hypothetical protein
MTDPPTTNADAVREAFDRLESRIDNPPTVEEVSLAEALGRGAQDVLLAAAGVVDHAALLRASPVVIPRPRLEPLEQALTRYLEAARAYASAP